MRRAEPGEKRFFCALPRYIISNLEGNCVVASLERWTDGEVAVQNCERVKKSFSYGHSLSQIMKTDSLVKSRWPDIRHLPLQYHSILYNILSGSTYSTLDILSQLEP